MNTIEIYQQDALQFLEGLKDETLDVLITDPPYWTLDKWRNVGTTTRLGGHRNKEEQRDEMFFKTIDQDYLWHLFLEIDRILKLDGHLYMFCDDIVQPILSNWIREAQDEHRFGECHMLIWDKVNMGMGYHYRRRYECIVFGWRTPRDGVRMKPRKLKDLGMSDVFQCKRVTNSYPTEKPLQVVQNLVTQSLPEGGTICDPFAGSGVVGAAVPENYNAKILLNDISPASMKHMREVTFTNSPDLFAKTSANIIWKNTAEELLG